MDKKFRAWDKDEKRFYYFTLQEMLERKPCYQGSFDTRMCRAEKSQWIGLSDKNKKEIYEDDIVNAWGGEYCQGYWEHTKYRWIIKDLICDGFLLGEFEYIEVIGNIYETPELISK